MTYRLLFAWILVCWSAGSLLAQTPQIDDNLPAESFLGEQFCFETNFTNSGAPGYGPYIRLDLPPGLTFDSASIFGTGGGVINVGMFPTAPGNQLTDPQIDQPVTGDPGNSLIILTFPVGSVVDGAPDLPLEICLTIDPSAEVGAPLPVGMTPVYRFGDSATGDNGPIIGGVVDQSVTPTVLLFSKLDSAPESERPPGPSWPYEYALTVDIANTATIQPLVIRDVLPADLQFLPGSVVISGGVGCTVTQTPPVSGPGGVLEVTCTGNTVGSSSADDVVVRYTGYITDILDETFCDIQPQINDASAQGTYVPPSGPVQVLPPATDQTTVSAEHVVVQKAVSPDQVAPGAALTYSLNFQVTDFGDASNLVVTDTLPDGIDFVSHGALSVAGTPVAITPSVTVNPNFTKSIVYDIGAAAGPVIGPIDAGSAISLSYNAEVREGYQDTGEPVLSSDSLTNTVSMDYDLVEGAAACTDGSAATVDILPVTLAKQIVNPQPFYVPGEQVHFRLTMNVPAGDTRAIRFEDFLPLPVFNVTDLDLAFGGPDIVRGPDDTAGLTPAAITISVAQNALFIDWPDLDSTTAQVIQVDLFATVTDDPFADGLFLTNILLGSTNNTPGATAIETGPVSFNVGAPEMVITKGVAATDGNGTIAPSPASLPVDGNLSDADAGDQVTYVITAENRGSAQAFDVIISDPGAAELTGCSVTSVTDGGGAPLGFSGSLAAGLVLDDPLAPNDGTPGAPFGADTALVTVDCSLDATVAPDTSFSNTASLSWASQPGAADFPPLTDDADVSIRNVGLEKIFVATSEPGTSDAANPPRVTIGEIVRYRLALRVPEGRIPALSLRDALPNGLNFLDDGSARAAFVSNGAGLTSSTLAIPTVSGNASSLAAVPSASVSFALPAGAISGGNTPVFAFGDVTNADDDGDNEFLLVEFNALVANTSTNNIGNSRNNTFSAFSGATNLNGSSNTVQVRVAEPSVSVSKSASPTTGDAGDVIAFTVVVGNSGGTNNSPAFDTRLVDTLPAGLVNLRNVILVPNAACTGLSPANNTVGDTLDLLFSVLQPGCAVSVSFDADLTAAVAPGSVITNTATSTWTSLPGNGGTGPNPTGSTTPGAPGSVTGERDGSGGVNDFTATGSANVNVPGVGLAKTVIATSEIETGSGEFRPAIEDLAIGESATFEIVATLPEGTAPQLVISDTLPFTNGVMRLDSAAIISVGANLSADNPAPPAVVSDTQLADGINDTVSFDFGQVSNTPDGVVDAADRVVIQVVATMVDVAANANGDALANTALVQFGPGLDASTSVGVDVVEPLLNIDKSGSITQGDAGDAVTFTITIDHRASSAAEAHDLVFQDVLPADLVLNPASVNVVSGPNFDVNTSAGNTVALGWIALDQADVIVLEYQATLSPGVMPEETVTNTGDLSWTSIAGANPDERTGNDSDAHAIVITEPGLDKIVFDTSEPSTGDAEFGPPADLTIGEQVTYRFTVEFPEGTSEAATVTDQLPTGSSVLQVVSSSVVRVGASLSGPGLPSAGAAGIASDSNADTVDDRVVWSLGDVLNTPDGVTNADDEIEFEVVAVVLDVAANQSGDDDQLNVATLQTTTSTVSGTAAIDLVAPTLALDKSIVTPADGFVDAGDTVTARLDISHTSASTADAFNLIVTDTLPASVNWAGDGQVSSNCPGLNVDSSGEPVISFDLAQLDQATGACFIEYQVTIDISAMPGQTLSNSAMLDYDSTPVFVAGQTRRRMDSDTAEVNVLAPSLVKVAVDTSLADTGMAQGDPGLLDLTIGETVTYRLTAVFPEGTSTNVVLIDQLPAGPGGVIEAIGAAVTAVGGNISTTLPGTPVFQDNALGDGLDDTVVLEFGTVTNTPDGVEDANDRIVIEIVGRVVDVAENSDGAVLTNNAQLSFDGGSLVDSADVEVVEPEVAIAKAMSMQADGVVRISLSLENTGTAPAYDLEVRDVFDEADWNLAEFTDVSVPAGFTLNLLPDTPAAGQQTLVFATDPGAISPDGTLPVGNSTSAVFEIPLAVLPPVPNPLPNTADLTGGDSLPGPDPNARDLPPDSDTAEIAVPDLALDKIVAVQVDADASTDASPGDTLRYTLTLRNTGAGPATDIVIDDAPDANSGLVAGSVTTSAGSVTVGNGAGDNVIQISIASLAAGGTVTITYDTTINNPLPDGVTELVNQALFDSTELPPGVSDDPDLPGPDDPTVVPLNAAPDLVITKDDGGTTTVPGGTVVWTLDYQNVGNQDATGVVISDTVPANTVFNPGASTAGWTCAPDNNPGSTCSFAVGDVAGGGGSGSVDFVVTVDEPLATGVAELVNSATIVDDGSNGPDPTPGNNNDGDTTPVAAAPDLIISKDDGGATSVPGGTVVWTLGYENVGNQNATGVVISDTVPANTVFNPGASTAGWTCAPDNNPGSTCTFAVGNVAGGGGSGSIDFAVTVDDPLTTGVTELANSAMITDDGSNGPDPTPGNNNDSDTTPVDAAPDLVIIKDDGGATTVPGGTVVWALDYQNVGNQDATGVVISETVPANTVFNPAASTAGWSCLPGTIPGSVCTLAIGSLAGDGAGGTVSFAVTVDDPLAAGVTQVANSASIVDDGNNGPDPTPGNNGDSDTTPVAAAPDLVITKDDGGATTVPGGTVVWTLGYQNVGNQDATGVVISDTVPANTVFNPGASSAGWVCAPDNNPGSTCSFAVGTVAGGGGSGSVDFAVTVDDPLATGVTELVNSATIADDGSNGPDPTPGNNNDGDTTPVDAAPDLVITKDDGGATTEPGGTVVWTLGYENVGNQDATGVVISDTVPANTVFNPGASTAGWTCAPDNNPGSACSFAIGAVAGDGGTGSVDFAVTVDDPLAAGVTELVNSASIADDGSNGPDPTPGNNDDGDTTPVEGSPDLAIVKSDGGITAAPGETVVFTLDYVNNGNQDATGVELTETVPPNSTFVAGSSTPGWACTPDGSAGNPCVLDIGPLAGGATGSASFAIVLDDPLPLDYEQIPNTAAIGDDGSNGPDPTPDDNDSSTLTPILLDPALDLVKVLSDAPDPIALGSVLEFTITATNTGNMTLTDVVVSDSLITPTGGTTPCASVAPGETCTLIGDYEVTQQDVDNGEVINTAGADSDQTDPVDTELVTPVPQNPDIDLLKQADLDDANGNGLGDAGEVINYTITVTNTGDVTLTDVEVFDSLLDDLTCVPDTPATLLPGEVTVCTGSLTIQLSDLGSGALVNVATTTASGPDGDTVDSSGNTVTVLNAPLAVPALDRFGLMLLALLLAMLGLPVLRRRFANTAVAEGRQRIR